MVIVIIAFLVTWTSNRFGRGNRELRRDVRNFAADVRNLRHKARMTNLTYRLVINMPESKTEEQTYWVESTSKKFTITYDEDVLKKQAEIAKETKKDPSGFAIDQSISKKGAQPLPHGLFFESVEIASQKKEFSAGRIFIHFFPEGRVEEAVIHIGDRDKLHWSLAIHPLTGQIDMIAGNKKLKEMQQE